MKLDTVESGWSIVYIEGTGYNFKKYLISNSADPDEMPSYVAYKMSLHLGLHCLT